MVQVRACQVKVRCQVILYLAAPWHTVVPPLPSLEIFPSQWKWVATEVQNAENVGNFSNKIKQVFIEVCRK